MRTKERGPRTGRARWWGWSWRWRSAGASGSGRRSIALAVLLAAPRAWAGLVDPAPFVLPVNAFAKAAPGEWTILEGETQLGGKLVHEREIIRVGAVEGGVAEVQLFEGQLDKESWFLSFPVDQRRGPDTNLLYDVPWIARGLKREPATCTLGAASFRCTKVTYQTLSHDANGAPYRGSATVLMSPKIRGSGIVSYELAREGRVVWKMRTIGYGTRGRTEWGVAPPREDLEANWDREGAAAMVGRREGSQADSSLEEAEGVGFGGLGSLGTAKPRAKKPGKPHPARGGPDLRGVVFTRGSR
jgi:hypothetical protein